MKNIGRKLVIKGKKILRQKSEARMIFGSLFKRLI